MSQHVRAQQQEMQKDILEAGSKRFRLNLVTKWGDGQLIAIEAHPSVSLPHAVAAVFWIWYAVFTITDGKIMKYLQHALKVVALSGALSRCPCYESRLAVFVCGAVSSS